LAKVESRKPRPDRYQAIGPGGVGIGLVGGGTEGGSGEGCGAGFTGGLAG
jgi:hypothetical protein